MSNTPAEESLRERARKRRERKEAEQRARRTEQEGLDRCRRAIEALGEFVYALRCSLDPFEPPATATELEAHYDKVTPLLADVLALLREANVLNRLEQLDEPATLAHYRQQHTDPQESQTACAHARQIIEADPTDHQALRQLVRDAAEEPGLRGAWDWVSILLSGLTGQQKLLWKQDPSDRRTPDPLSPPSVDSSNQDTEEWIFAPSGNGYFIAGLGGRGYFPRLKGFGQILQVVRSSKPVSMLVLAGGAVDARLCGDPRTRQPAIDDEGVQQIKERWRELDLTCVCRAVTDCWAYLLVRSQVF
jgi:hypothetical protein